MRSLTGWTRVLMIGACLLGTRPIAAAVIVEHPSALFVQDQFIPGQSFLTPGPSGWNNLRFNWFSDIATTLPTAFGTLTLLDQEYLGTANNLNGATPGFLGQSLGIVAGQYVFDAGLALNPNTQYFVYTSQAGLLAGETLGTYADGILYSDNGFGPNGVFFQFATQDAAFRLEGSRAPVTTVPEPSTLALGGLVLLGFAKRRWRWSSRR